MGQLGQVRESAETAYVFARNSTVQWFSESFGERAVSVTIPAANKCRNVSGAESAPSAKRRHPMRPVHNSSAKRPIGVCAEQADDLDRAEPSACCKLAGEPTQALVIRTRQGDQCARDALIARFWMPLRRWAEGRLPQKMRSSGDTEDLVQITVMRALSRIEQFRNEGKGSFLVYLRQILLNELRDEIRRGNRTPEKVEVDDEMVDMGMPSPVDMVVGHEYLSIYETVLATLSKRQQSVIVMRVEQCMSYPEIARAIGETPDCVRMMIARAMTKLAAGMRNLMPIVRS